MLLKYRINYLSGVARPTFDLLFFEINAIQRVFLPSPVRRWRIIHQTEMPRFEFRRYFYRNGGMNLWRKHIRVIKSGSLIFPPRDNFPFAAGRSSRGRVLFLPSFLPFLRGISPAFVCFDHASKVWQPSTRAGQDSAFLIPKRWPKFKLSEESKRFEYSSSWEGLFRRSSVSMRSGFWKQA